MVFIAAATLNLAATAQAQNASDGGWHYLLQPYVMFPNLNGEIGVGNLPTASVDENPSDIFGQLQAGAMLYAEAKHDCWAVSSDFLYMKLGADVAGGAVISSGEVEVKQLGWEVDVLRDVLPWLEVGIGAQLNQIESDVKVVVNTPSGPESQTDKLSQTWLDPTIVARAKSSFAENWFVRPRVNIGGFGVGSDFSWQVQVDVGYHVSQLMILTLGYRAIGIDYDHGSGQDRFLYDLTTFGPVLKVGFKF
jgi:hypothetical protein